MAVGINELDRLHLDELFPGEGKHAYINAFSVSRDSFLLVIDDSSQNKTVFSTAIDLDRDFGLLVLNSRNDMVVLLAIDHVLVEGHAGGIADGALLHQNQFVFVEFKTNALGNSDPSILDTFDKAISQLKETLRYFEAKLSSLSINLKSSFDVSCYIVLAHSFPKATASKQDASLSFLDEEGIMLSFETQIKFS